MAIVDGVLLAGCSSSAQVPESPTKPSVATRTDLQVTGTDSPDVTAGAQDMVARVAAIEAARSRVGRPSGDLTAMSSTLTADPWAIGASDRDTVAPVEECPALASAAAAGPALQAVVEDLTVALNPVGLVVDRTRG